MEKNSLLLLSGGIGARMQKSIPKQHLLLFGRPIIIHSLERIDKLVDIDKVVITCNKSHINDLKEMTDKYGFKKEIIIIEGGKTRQESVYKGLLKINTPSVIIHEAARPFVRLKEFQNLIDSKEKNITYGINIPYTVLKKKGGFIVENLNRSNLINIQLPQKFNTEELKLSHINAIENKKEYTEDTSLILDTLKEKIKILEGTEFNIKITNPIDYKIAEIIYKDYILNEE
jgi:2-C-methyl-D-erythritol 4-phosphate cytidylyltransferase